MDTARFAVCFLGYYRNRKILTTPGQASMLGRYYGASSRLAGSHVTSTTSSASLVSTAVRRSIYHAALVMPALV